MTVPALMCALLLSAAPSPLCPPPIAATPERSWAPGDPRAAQPLPTDQTPHAVTTHPHPADTALPEYSVTAYGAPLLPRSAADGALSGDAVAADGALSGDAAAADGAVPLPLTAAADGALPGHSATADGATLSPGLAVRGAVLPFPVAAYGAPLLPRSAAYGAMPFPTAADAALPGHPATADGAMSFPAAADGVLRHPATADGAVPRPLPGSADGVLLQHVVVVDGTVSLLRPIADGDVSLRDLTAVDGVVALPLPGAVAIRGTGGSPAADDGPEAGTASEASAPVRPVSGGEEPVRAASGGEVPAAEPTSVPAVVPSGGPEPTAEPSEAEWSGRPDAEPGTVQVVHHVSTTPAPAATVARVVGNASTVLLALLGVAALALRLTVGWPRFPEPYLGRRRAGGDRDDPW
ncbi:MULTISPECIES: hypothetical protein [unclassified Nocardiopsis]|uniref:hypothetical protein n=1 Tax=Nocardiopsis TaxID=2013 RepID=UPI00387B1494